MVNSVISAMLLWPVTFSDPGIIPRYEKELELDLVMPIQGPSNDNTSNTIDLETSTSEDK